MMQNNDLGASAKADRALSATPTEPVVSAHSGDAPLRVVATFIVVVVVLIVVLRSAYLIGYYGGDTPIAIAIWVALIAAAFTTAIVAKPSAPSIDAELRLKCLTLAQEWAKLRFREGYSGVGLHDIVKKADEYADWCGGKSSGGE